jgi:ferredoxin-NADP reductase
MSEGRSEIETVVSEVRQETSDAVTLRLDLQGRPFRYKAGQFVEIDPHQFPGLADRVAELESAKGMRESRRGFSLCSDPSDQGFLEISVKEGKVGKYPPLLSPWLVQHSRVGQSFRILGPFGHYHLPEQPPPTRSGYLHLCAGSGVAPNRGMIRYALGRGWPHRHLLVLQNRTEDDIFYRDEWPELMRRYPDRLKVRHIFSVPTGQHVDVDLLHREMEGFLEGSSAQAMVCGPNQAREFVGSRGTRIRFPGFCELWCGNPRRNAEGLLLKLGFTPDRILTESW